MKTPKEYLAEIGAKGGKKSRRKLTKKEARRIAMVRWAAGAGVGLKPPTTEATDNAADQQPRREDS